MNCLRITLLIVTVFLASQASAVTLGKNPTLSEAKLQLGQLEETVKASIRSAENAFLDLEIHMQNHAGSTLKKGELAIDKVHASVSADLEAIKAKAAGQDISYCTGGREQMINHLPSELKLRLSSCIGGKNYQIANVLSDARYAVDVVITRVHELEYKLNLCQGETECVSSIISQIEEELVLLPQKVKAEVNSVQTIFGNLIQVINTCSEKNVAEFTTHVTSLLNGISVCVDKILA